MDKNSSDEEEEEAKNEEAVKKDGDDSLDDAEKGRRIHKVTPSCC